MTNVQHQQRGGVERVEVERVCARRQLHGVTAEDENTEAVSVEVDEKNESAEGVAATRGGGRELDFRCMYI